MKFKPNYFITFSITMLELFTSFTPVVFLIQIFDKDPSTKGVHALGFLMIAFIFFIILNCLNIVTLPFSKAKVHIYKHHFQHLDKKWSYDKITLIEIEKGMVSKTGSNEPTTIILRLNDQTNTFIEYPSIILMIILIVKCKYAKVKIKDWYRIFLFCLLSFGIMAILILAGYFNK